MAGRHRLPSPPRRRRHDAARATLAALIATTMGAGLQAVEHLGGRVTLAPPPPLVAGPPPLVPVVPLPGPTIAPPTTTTAAPPATAAPTTRPTRTSRPPPPPPPPPKSCPSSGFGGVQPHVARVGWHLKALFDVDRVGGVGARSNPSDHPVGLALDFFVNRATGDELAAYALKRRDDLSVKYVIWRQRINYGDGWEPMPDRGGTTANHYDHVHISFRASGSGVELTC